MATKSKQPQSSPYGNLEQSAMMPAVGERIKKATRARPGQPTKRTDAVVEEILDRIACGESLIAVCQDDHLPGYSTFNRWCREDVDLLHRVDIAYQFHARTMDDLADDMLAGGPSSTGDFKRDEARVGHLRWRLGKLNRRFREKQEVEVTQYEPIVIDVDCIQRPALAGQPTPPMLDADIEPDPSE